MQNIYATEWPSISAHITNYPFNPNSREYGGEMSDTNSYLITPQAKRIKTLEAALDGISECLLMPMISQYQMLDVIKRIVRIAQEALKKA